MTVTPAPVPPATPMVVPCTVSDENGRTRFVEVTLSSRGRGAALRTDAVGTTSAAFTLVDPGWEPVFRAAPRRQFVVLLQGIVDIECGSGEVRRFGPGGVLLVTDVDGDGHIFRVVEGPVRAMNVPLADEVDLLP